MTLLPKKPKKNISDMNIPKLPALPKLQGDHRKLYKTVPGIHLKTKDDPCSLSDLLVSLYQKFSTVDLDQTYIFDKEGRGYLQICYYDFDGLEKEDNYELKEFEDKLKRYVEEKKKYDEKMREYEKAMKEYTEKKDRIELARLLKKYGMPSSSA